MSRQATAPTPISKPEVVVADGLPDRLLSGNERLVRAVERTFGRRRDTPCDQPLEPTFAVVAGGVGGWRGSRATRDPSPPRVIIALYFGRCCAIMVSAPPRRAAGSTRRSRSLSAPRRKFHPIRGVPEGVSLRPRRLAQRCCATPPASSPPSLRPASRWDRTPGGKH